MNKHQLARVNEFHWTCLCRGWDLLQVIPDTRSADMEFKRHVQNTTFKKKKERRVYMASVSSSHFVHWGKLIRREKDVWYPVCEEVAGRRLL